MIKNIIFDIGNVLAHFRWKQYISEKFPETLQERIAKATVRGPYWDEVDRGALPIDEVVKLCASLEPELAKEIEEFFRERTALVEEYNYSAKLIRQLKKQGYHIYLLSNYAGDLYEYARTHFEFIPLADGEMISYQIKKIKPEPEIYTALLEKYKLKPEECVFLDDLERNLEGAKKFGIHTILFTDYNTAMKELKTFGCEVIMEENKQKYSALLFDLDGTLWDTTDAAAQIWSDVAANYPGITEKVTGEKLRKLYGLPLEDIAQQLFSSSPKELAINVMEECVKVQCPILAKGGGKLIGDVRTALLKLRKSYKIFIVSNCRSGYIEAFLESHKLGDLVDDFTCPGDTGKLKAENIRLICERNNVPLSKAVYIGDTYADEQAVREAGIPFVFAEYGFGQAEHCDYRIFDILELCEVLEQDYNGF